MLKIILEFLSRKQVYGTFIIIVVTLIIYKITNSFIDKIVINGKDELEKKRRKTLVHILKNIFKYILFIIMIIILLNLYGINTNKFIAGLGIAGVVIGFALQEALKDIINGISIIFDNYFVVGDIVEYNGFTGTVIEFGLKSTKIKKISGEVLIIANRYIDKITNISKEKATIVLNILTAYEEKFEKVEKVLTETLEKAKETHSEITNIEFLGIENFKESGIEYSIRITCKRETHWNIRREVLKEIKKAYEKNKIKIPYNQLEVHNNAKL